MNPKKLDPLGGRRRGRGATRRRSTGDTVVALAVFVIIASLSIAIPVVWYLANPSRAQQHLDALKSWMSEHNAAVMAVLFLVFGVVLIAKGLDLLTV